MPWYFYNNRGVLKTDGFEDAIPVGTISMFLSDDVTPTVPTGWVLCDGSAIPSTMYPDLSPYLSAAPSPPNPAGYKLLPNFNTSFPIGSGTGFALKQTDTSVSRYRHRHGGSTTTPHTHTVANHTHTISNHDHWYNHSHQDSTAGGGHKHTDGTLYLDSVQNGFGFNVQADSPNVGDPSTLLAAGPLSVSPHQHDVAGTSDAPVNNYPDPLFTVGPGIPSTNVSDAIVGPPGWNITDAAGGYVSNSAVRVIPLAGSDILPPYLNTYFIIKAVDYSGEYI